MSTLIQLNLFSNRVMKKMERKVKKERKEKIRHSERDITIWAMEDCMRDGGYDRPETAEELCFILGLI